MKKIFLISILIFTFSCKEFNFDEARTIENEDTTSTKNIILSDFDYIPTSTTNEVYFRDSYSFSYSENHEQSEWVAYYLDVKESNTSNYQRPYFQQDPLVVSSSADWRNYKNSGYDKGHLCPAGDRKSSYNSYKETFYTSNVSPQEHQFNSGVWNRLEEKTRYWASKNNGIYVVTGGVLSDNLKTIGTEKVAVPKYFYKVLLTKDGAKMIGFLVPHSNSKKALYEFVVPVDTIEKMTGIDFYPNLEDTIEKELESKSDYKGWSF